MIEVSTARRGRDATEPAVETARNRMIIAGALFTTVFAAIGLRLVDVTLFTHRDSAAMADAAQRDGYAPGRGVITDRNGTLLAASLSTASLYADATVVPDPYRATDRLVGVLPELDRSEVLTKLKSDRRFVWIKRHLTPRQEYAVNRLGIPGLDFRREDRRVYPMGRAASHIVGFTDIDGHGLAGVERFFDTRLADGKENIVLSLDMRVQHLLRRSLSEAKQKFSAIGAAGVVMDVTTGEVLAMVSLPDFDPNHPGAIDADARFNRASLGVYEMGSTFKIFTTAMALDSGTVKLSDGYDASQPIHVARFTIRDYHAKRRWLSVPEIFMYSSNIGAVKMALDVGGDRQRDFLRKLGMFEPTPVELPETGQPLLPEVWRRVSTMTVSFGHGLSVSPLHLAAGVAAVVNGGIYYPPTVIKRTGPPDKGRRVVSAATSEKMRRLMRLVVESGTGRNARAEGYLVGGKTGTADKAVGRGYSHRALLSSFVGVFPMTKPRYVVLAILDEPKGRKDTFGYATGGWVAAPVVRDVVARMGPLLGMQPLNEESPEIEARMHVAIASPKEEKARLASY